MLLNKTDKAREALGAGSSAGLSLQDRRILILVDGRRSLDEVMAMLGANILPAIDRLLREGYIARHRSAPAAATPALGGAVSGLLRAATEAMQARTEQIRATTTLATSIPAAPAPAPAAPAGPATIATTATPVMAIGARRSLAACKMYLLDMLQLQRSTESAELRAAIQCAAGPAALLDALFDALHMLVATSTRSYGDRIVQRLAEILPEEALPRLDALRGERAGAASLSIVAA